MPYGLISALRRMRIRLLLFILLLVGLSPLRAQVIISESFEQGVPPPGWTRFNAGLGNEWTLMPSNSGYQLSGTRCMQYPASSSFPGLAWIFSKPIRLETGVSYRLSYWYRSSFSNMPQRMKVSLGMAPTIPAQTVLLSDYPSITNTTYQEGIDNITVGTTGDYYFSFLCNSPASSLGTLLIDSVVFQQITPTVCNGTPVKGQVAGPEEACAGTSFQLSLDGTYTGAGLGFQWQSKLAGETTFTNIAGATSRDLTTTQTATRDYRCIVTCSNSGLSSVSDTLRVVTPSICYCKPPASNCVLVGMLSVTLGSIVNTNPDCSLNGYNDFTGLFQPASVNMGGNLNVSVYLSFGGQQRATLWIDFNRDGTFASNEQFQIGVGGSATVINNTVAIPTGLQTGPTRARIRVYPSAQSGSPCGFLPDAQTHDYSINIQPQACSAPPAPGTIVGPMASVCADSTFMVRMAGSYTGFQLQWLYSPKGANNFTDIPGATSQALYANQTVSSDYRCKVTCPTTGTFIVSSIYTVNSSSFCYCVPNSTCSPSFYIKRVTFGSLDNASNCDGYTDYTGTVQAPVLQAGTYIPITIAMGVTTPQSTGVWIDYNQNGVFDAEEYTNLFSSGLFATGNIFIPSNAYPGPTRMRVRRKNGELWRASEACKEFKDGSTYGETEDYLVNILAAPVAIYSQPFVDSLYDPATKISCRIVHKDVGIDQTASLRPRVWAKRLEATQWKSFPGTLQSGNATNGEWVFLINNDSLGVRRNGCDSIQYYFVAQDVNTPPNIGFLPEIGASHTNVNTQVTAPGIPFGYRLVPRLKDTVYVSASDCRYQSLSAKNGIFDDIAKRGLEGDLTILIESDLIESAEVPLRGDRQNGHRIKIAPASASVKKVYIQLPLMEEEEGAIVRMLGVKNMVLDGSFGGQGNYLHFYNPVWAPHKTDTISIVKMENGCDSILIQNMIFKHVGGLYEGGENAILMGEGANTRIYIKDNFFSDLEISGYTNFPERFITSVSSGNEAVISGNHFNNFAQSGIRSYAYTGKWIIENNHFYRSSVETDPMPDVNMIWVFGGQCIIRNNYFGGKAPYCGGGAFTMPNQPAGLISAILIHSHDQQLKDTVIITGNKISNIEVNWPAIHPPDIEFAGIYSTQHSAIIADNEIGEFVDNTPSIKFKGTRAFGVISLSTGNVQVKNNHIKGMEVFAGHFFGIEVNGENSVTATTNYVIQDNSISQLKNRYESIAAWGNSPGKVGGIYTDGGGQGIIQQNLVHHIETASGIVTGIVVYRGGYSNLSVSRNKIYDLTNVQPTVGGDCCNAIENYNPSVKGIFVNRNNASLRIDNNQIALNNDNILSFANIQGITVAAGTSSVPPTDPALVVYNSIYLGGQSKPAGFSVGMSTSDFSKVDFRNNLIVNERSGGTKGNMSVYARQITSAENLNDLLNNNVYIIPDTSVFAWVGSAVSYYYGWKAWAELTKADSQSFVYPVNDMPPASLFSDLQNGDLNIRFDDPVCWIVKDRAMPLPGFPQDFDDGNIRITDASAGMTDVGSDEFFTNVNPPGSVCEGATARFTANGNAVTYQWQIWAPGGFQDLSNDARYSGVATGNLQINQVPLSLHGTIYRCVGDGQPLPGEFRLTVLASINPSIQIEALQGEVCAGESVLFKASISDAGNTPSIKWLRNGVDTVGQGIDFTAPNLVHGDRIKALLTIGAGCAIEDTVFSNEIIQIVRSVAPLKVTIAGSTQISAGSSAIITAVAEVDGGSIAYQWQDSTSTHSWLDINNATQASIDYTPATSGVAIRCIANASNTCAAITSDTSNILQFELARRPVSGSNPIEARLAGLTYFPNPTSGLLMIDSLKLADEWLTLEILTVNGYNAFPVTSIEGKTKIELRVDVLTQGQYLVLLRRRNGPPAYIKLIKM